MGQQGPPGAKKKTFYKNDPRPHGMPKQVFVARFEFVVARFGPPKILKFVVNGVFWNKEWVKNGSKMCFSKNDPRTFAEPQQVK